MSSQQPIIAFPGPSESQSSAFPSIGGFSGDVNIVSNINQGFYTYTKNGFNVSYQEPSYYWQPLSVTAPFSTRSIYDTELNRWFTVELDNSVNTNSNFLLSVSNNMDFTKGSHYSTSIPIDPTDLNYGNQINLALNSQYLIVTIDLKSIEFNTESGSLIYAFRKSDLLNSILNYARILDPINLNLCPVLSYDPDPKIYILHTGFNTLTIGSLTIGPSFEPTYISNLRTFRSSQSWNAVGGYAPQLNSATTINLGDDRVQDATLYNDKLWLAHSIFGIQTSSIMTWEIDIAALTVLKNQVISIGNSYLSYPSIAVNKHNDVAVIFAEFSPSIYPSISYAYQDHTDTNFRSPLRLANGKSSYPYSTWGNYFAASIDSADLQSFWLQGETTNESHKWEVMIYKVDPIFYVPLAPYDFFKENVTQISTYTSGNSQWNFYQHNSYQFGINADDKIVPGKVFSSAEDSLIVWNPDVKEFKIMPSLLQSFSSLLINTGNPNDVPLTGDLLGSGTSLLILFNSGVWKTFDIYQSQINTYDFGIHGDIPLIGDWMDLKRKQLGIWRPSNGTFYFLDVVTGKQGGIVFGVPYPSIYNDIPVVGDFLGDGYDQVVIFRSLTGQWFIQDYLQLNDVEVVEWGTNGDIPLEGKFNPATNGNDIAIYRPSNNTFFVRGYETISYGNPGDIPIPGSAVYYRMKLLGLL